MRDNAKITICIFFILVSTSASVYAIFWSLWKTRVTVRIDPLTPRSSDLSVSCTPSTIIIGDIVLITGQLVNATSREGIPGQLITLYYKPSGSYSWTFLKSVMTLFDGTFSHSWTDTLELASSSYVINATFTGSVEFDGWTSLTALQVCAGAIAIAITNVTPSKTVVGQGYSMSINVTVENQGDFTETLNVTAYYNETAIILPNGRNYTTITLTSGNSTTITFTWNTTGLPKGNYIIWAYAWPVLDEIETEDNTYTDGTVLITIPGDINGDRKVDGKDIAVMSKFFGCRKEQPCYVPNADINCDGKIDGKDIAIASKNFAQIDP